MGFHKSPFEPATIHTQSGLEVAQTIQPLSPTGQVEEVNGHIVLLFLGMSNTLQEFQAFMSLAPNEPLLAGPVEIVVTR